MNFLIADIQIFSLSLNWGEVVSILAVVSTLGGGAFWVLEKSFLRKNLFYQHKGESEARHAEAADRLLLLEQDAKSANEIRKDLVSTMRDLGTHIQKLSQSLAVVEDRQQRK
jgi:hypothetical protein